jgi:lactoylglutathione lyase
MNGIIKLSPFVRSYAVRAVTTKAATASHPFRILGVQQIAIGSADRGPLNALWRDIFDLKADSHHLLEKENVEEDIVKLGPRSHPELMIELDFMTPINPEASPKVSAVYGI